MAAPVDPVSVVAAIKACERPDNALQLAFDATDDRKAVIRYASNIIPLLRNEGLVAGIVRPYPDAREAVDVYSNNMIGLSIGSAIGRATFLGTVVAAVLAFGLGHSGLLGFRLALVILIPLLTILIRVVFARIVQRQAARLDDESAFAIVVGHVTRAVDKDSSRVALTMSLLQRNLLKLFEARPK